MFGPEAHPLARRDVDRLPYTRLTGFDLKQMARVPLRVSKTMSTPLLYRCPETGTMVQTMAELVPPAADGSKQYRAIECLACKRMHFLNAVTGKLMSEEADD